MFSLGVGKLYTTAIKQQQVSITQNTVACELVIINVFRHFHRFCNQYIGFD